MEGVSFNNANAGTEAEIDRSPATHFDLIWILFSLRGRLSLGLMWIAIALSALTGIGFLVLGAVLSDLHPVLATLCFIGALVMAWSHIVIGVKRFHDIGWPGWLILLGLVPVFGQVFLFFMIGSLKGNRGPNRYGIDPRRIWSLGMIDDL
jgi:uncharacterized membrane protein YhaH (DUF805 family)